MGDKLARVGLIPERQVVTLGDFLQRYIEGRVDVKPASRVVWRHTKRNLLALFGPDRTLQSITAGDTEDFRIHLVQEGLASTTIHKRLQFARQFFKAMKQRKLVIDNPFAEVRHKAGDSSDRQHFITPDDTQRLIDAAPDSVWRTIIALARYGGLRCPSEVLSLEWANVDWERNRFRAMAPKTAHHPGKGSRVVPLFAELRPYLEEAWEMAKPGQQYVIPEARYRKASLGPEGWRNCNIRTQFERMIKRAGMEPWPRLFHNLRASRETELAREHPIHAATFWLGNSPRTAMKHYLQVTEADMARAVGQGGNRQPERGVVQQVVQQGATGSDREPQGRSAQGGCGRGAYWS